jgi:hypothetical protein
VEDVPACALDAIAACDFFTVDVLTWTGLTRFYVLFVVALETRRVEIAGIICQPHGAWLTPSRSIKSECLHKFVLLSEGNHQGLDGRLIASPASASGAGPIVCRERIGGLLRFYHRLAA